jgi:hypothetical protein
MITILFLAAEPSDTVRLRLGEEIRTIQEKLQLAKLRDDFVLRSCMSIRSADISQALLDLNPQIVHFSGHGTSGGALFIEDRTGKAQPISPEALAALFEQFSNKVKCVVLNACYSDTQAQSIVTHIENVIGMNRSISDRAAIAFSVGFYQALGAGRSIEDAYKFGCIQVKLENIPEYLTPILLKKSMDSSSVSSNEQAIGAYLYTKSNSVSYNLNVLDEWENKLKAGFWNEIVDCRDNILLQDLRQILAHVLEQQNISPYSIENTLVALTELWRNVKNHATSTISKIEISINFKYLRFILSVSSDGQPFTLDYALNKYKTSLENKKTVHGIENLITRGDIEITSDRMNIVKFSCRLATKAETIRDTLQVSLFKDRIFIGSREYSYRSWYYIIFGNINEDLAYQSEPNFESLFQIVISQWKSNLPISISITYEPPNWTLNSFEILITVCFKKFSSILKQDKRFLALEVLVEDEF